MPLVVLALSRSALTSSRTIGASDHVRPVHAPSKNIKQGLQLVPLLNTSKALRPFFTLLPPLLSFLLMLAQTGYEQASHSTVYGSTGFLIQQDPRKVERLMVLTALGGLVKTEDAEKALIKMHSRIHLLRKKNAQPSKGKGQSGKAFYGKGRKGKTFKGASYSYLSTTEELFEDPYADGSTDGAAYPALDGEDDWSYPGYTEEDGEGDEMSGDGAKLVACTADAPLKDVELDVFTAFMTT